MAQRSMADRWRRLLRLSDGPYHALTVCYGRKLLADHPDFAPAWIIVGQKLADLARYEEAEQALAKAIEFCEPNYVQLALAPMGHLFREAGDYDQAAAWYRRAIAADPEDASYHIYLGCVLAKQGRFHEAAEAHRIATRCRDGCIEEAYLNLGLVLRALQRFDDAAECFREALQRDPEHRLALRALRDVEFCSRFQRRTR